MFSSLTLHLRIPVLSWKPTGNKAAGMLPVTSQLMSHRPYENMGTVGSHPHSKSLCDMVEAQHCRHRRKPSISLAFYWLTPRSDPPLTRSGIPAGVPGGPIETSAQRSSFLSCASNLPVVLHVPGAPQVLPAAQHRMMTAPVHLWCTLETQRFPMIFNDSHVAHLVRSPRSARVCRGPLSRRAAVGRDHTVELFIFTRFSKGSSMSIRF